MGALVDAYASSFSGSFNMAVLLWPLLSAFLTLPILALLYRRDGWLRLATVFAVYASVLYAAGLVCFTLYPLPTGDEGPGITYGIPPILDPLRFVDDIASDGMHAVLQLLFNIILFVPLGFIASTLLKLGFAPAFALSLGTTCLIETAQLTGLFGAYPFAFRTFDVDDIVCNALGGLIGWALGSLATRVVMRSPEGPPPITHAPSFARRFVMLWTDVLIIDVCFVIPRLVAIVAVQLAFESDPAARALAIDQANAVLAPLCFAVAFAIVEVVIPWRHEGSTPAGTFYRASCETRLRSGANRIVFYAARTATLFALLAFLRYLAIPLAIFYAIARRMPYDFVPADEDEPASPALAEASEAERA